MSKTKFLGADSIDTEVEVNSDEEGYRESAKFIRKKALAE